jgi:hypothetical protein
MITGSGDCHYKVIHEGDIPCSQWGIADVDLPQQNSERRSLGNAMLQFDPTGEGSSESNPGGSALETALEHIPQASMDAKFSESLKLNGVLEAIVQVGYVEEDTCKAEIVVGCMARATASELFGREEKKGT